MCGSCRKKPEKQEARGYCLGKRHREPIRGLSAKEQKVLDDVWKKAEWWDTRHCGYFSISTLIGATIVGGFVTAFFKARLVKKAHEIEDLSLRLSLIMLGNVLLDLLLTVAGLEVGDLVANLVLPCNSRNAFLLQRHLEKRARRRHDLEGGPPAPPPMPARAITSPAVLV